MYVDFMCNVVVVDELISVGKNIILYVQTDLIAYIATPDCTYQQNNVLLEV